MKPTRLNSMLSTSFRVVSDDAHFLTTKTISTLTKREGFFQSTPFSTTSQFGNRAELSKSTRREYLFILRNVFSFFAVNRWRDRETSSSNQPIISTNKADQPTKSNRINRPIRSINQSNRTNQPINILNTPINRINQSIQTNPLTNQINQPTVNQIN